MNSSDEEKAVHDILLRRFAGTQYGCSSLTLLASRPGHYVYRGIFSKQIATRERDETIIIKQRTLPPDSDEEIYEGLLIRWLHESICYTSDSTTVVLPHVWMYIQAHDTQILQDFYDSQSFSQFLRGATIETLSAAAARNLGQHLGLWLAKFHNWTSESRQAVLRDSIRKQRLVRDEKLHLVYGRVVEVLRKYPVLADGHLDALEAFQRSMVAEELPEADDDPAWGVVHGDLWSGNILIKHQRNVSESSMRSELCVIDWKFAQYGHRAIDLGQLIGDILEQQLVFNIIVAQPLIEGIIKGYGRVTEDMAFRTASYIGAHLTNWDIRRPAGEVSPEIVNNVLTTGRDFLLKSLARDASYFVRTAIQSLF